MTEPRPIVITVETGPCQGASAILRGAQALLGRDADCTLCLPDDTTVSRRHASLCWEGGNWVLRDHASKNGTFVAAQGVLEALTGPRVLQPGDRFAVGSAIVSLAALEAPEVSPASLRVSLAGAVLRYELESGSAVVLRAEQPYHGLQVAALHREMHAEIGSAQATGGASDRQFLEIGRKLAAALLPTALVEALRSETSQPLMVMLEPALIGVAWEALVLDQLPLCLDRPLSRRILLENVVPRPAPMGRRMLIVANPTNDLPHAQRHAESLLELLSHEMGLPKVSFLAGRRATVRNVSTALAACDVAIFMGHAEHAPEKPAESGWCLADGCLSCREIAGLSSVPGLVIAAACESARETPSALDSCLLPEGTGMATGFLLSGVQQYVGALWRVPVVSGTAFATVLLREILGGAPMGVAMHGTRAYLRGVLNAPLYACVAQAHYGTTSWKLRP